MLTDEGVALLAAMGDAIGRIEAAVAPLQRRQREIRLSTVNTLAANWLLPRLPRFQQPHPAIEISVLTTQRVVELEAEDVDCAIRHGSGDWPGVDATLLFRETLVPAAAPALPLDLPPSSGWPVIRARARFRDWPRWWQASGQKGPPPEGGIVVENRAQALEAALAGAGVVLNRCPLSRCASLVRPVACAGADGGAGYRILPCAAAGGPQSAIHGCVCTLADGGGQGRARRGMALRLTGQLSGWSGGRWCRLGLPWLSAPPRPTTGPDRRACVAQSRRRDLRADQRWVPCGRTVRLHQQPFGDGDIDAACHRREDGGDGERGMDQDALQQCPGARQQLAMRHHGVHQPQFQRTLRRERLPREQQFHGPLAPGEARQTLRAAECGRHAEADFRLGEGGAVAGDSEGRGFRHLASAAIGKAVDGHHDGLAERLDPRGEPLAPRHEVPQRRFGALGHRAGKFRDIAPGGKGAPGSGEDDAPDIVVAFDPVEQAQQRIDGLVAQGVQLLGPVQGQGGDRAIHRLQDKGCHGCLLSFGWRKRWQRQAVEYTHYTVYFAVMLKPPDTRGKIVQAASRLFYDEGIGRVSMDAVAEKAGVTKRTLYYHFDSKDDLVAAYLDARDQPNLKQMAGWFAAASGGTDAKVAAIFEALARSARHPKWKGCGFLRTTAELAALRAIRP